MKKRLFALLTSIIFILSTCSICIAATTEKSPVNPILELSQSQISSQITLYNSSDDYCATYFKLKNGGYVIFDSTTNTLLEYSLESDFTHYESNGKKQIYLGPQHHMPNSLRLTMNGELVMYGLITNMLTEQFI